MTPSFLRDLLANKLTINTLIVEATTDLGGGLYSYMLMLEKQKRDTEAELIKILRTEIFAVRDKYINTGKLTDSHVDRLERAYALFNVQMKMISASKENSWETHMFQSYTNEFLGLIYFLKDICSKSIEEKNVIKPEDNVIITEECSKCNTTFRKNELSVNYSSQYRYLCSSCEEMVSDT